MLRGSGQPPGEVPVFVIFVPSAEDPTCATWLRTAEQKQQRTREARRDGDDLAVVDDLRVVAEDLRAPRLNVSWGAGHIGQTREVCVNDE